MPGHPTLHHVLPPSRLVFGAGVDAAGRRGIQL